MKVYDTANRLAEEIKTSEEYITYKTAKEVVNLKPEIKEIKIKQGAGRMKNYVFGVDVGGTTVKLGFFDTQGNVLDKWEIPTRKENKGAAIIGEIAQSLKEKMAESQEIY